MKGTGSKKRQRRLLIALLVVVLVTTPGFEVVVGTGESMEPRYQPCDLVLVDTIRDISAVHVHDTIAYRSGSGLIVHEVVGVTLDQDSVLARGVNRETRDRVTSEMLVGVVVAHLDTSAVCSAIG